MEIENIFIKNELEAEMESVVQTNRVKVGEVFQLQNNQLALVCIRCLEEFQYFTEFTLHVEDHLQNVLLGSLMESISPERKHALESNTEVDIDTEIKMERNINEYHSDGGIFDGNDCNDTHSDDDFERQLPNVLKRDAKRPHSKRNEKNIIKKKVKKVKGVRKPKTHFKKKINDPKYEQLVNAFEPIAFNHSNQCAFESLKNYITSSMFPSNVKDTVEVRMLAMYIQKGYNYKQKDDKLLCPICDNDNTYKDLDSVRRHVLTHVREPVFECDLCLATFRAPRYLRAHLNREHLSDFRTFECVFCKKTFKYFRQLKNHALVHSSGKLECIPCDKKFKILSFYQLHMKNVHGNADRPEIKYENVAHQPSPIRKTTENPMTYECYMCKNTFRNRRCLRSHMRIHNQEKQLCLRCGVTCSTTASMNRHLKLHESIQYTCEICDKNFSTRIYLMRHKIKVHQIWADNQRPVCRVCGVSFEKKSLLYDHMKIHPFEETRHFICTICNHAAMNSYSLKRHMETHNQKNWKCPICNKTYREVYAKEHTQTHEKPKYQCDICFKMFKRSFALKQHMYQHGIEAPEHVCDICSKVFQRSDKLLMHRRKHDVPLNYHCTVCGKGFITSKSCEIHENGHKNRMKM